MEGKKFSSPEVPKIEKNKEPIDKSEQLDFIKKLKNKY